MKNADEFRKNAWTAICDLYRAPSVSEFCVRLQDEYGVDVPLLLLSFHADQYGTGGNLEEYNAFLADAASWHEDVVKPLRTIRQGMKGRYTEDDEVQLREAVKALELRAEQIHVSRLADSFLLHENTTGAQVSDAYLQWCGVPADKRVAARAVFQAAAGGANNHEHSEERRLL